MQKRKYLCHMAAALSIVLGFSACTAGNSGQAPSEESSQTTPANSSQAAEDSQQTSADSETDGITPALWRVTDTSGHTLYCFGSIHATDGTIEFPEYFENAYAVCDSTAFEYDVTSSLDLGNALSSMTNYMYMDGTTIKDHIPIEDYNKAVEILTENNLYTVYYDYFNVIFWFSLMESVSVTQAGLDAMQAVDIQLINRAKADGKPVLEVESEAEQMAVLGGLSNELQLYLLESYLDEGAMETQTAALTETYGKWKKGEDLSESEETELSAEEQALVGEYNDVMLTQRNIKMADAAESYIQSGNTVMMVVGTAHYYGDNSVLNLLQERGYTVERVSA